MATTQFITEYDLGLNIATKLDDRMDQYEMVNGEQAEAIILGEVIHDLLNAYLQPQVSRACTETFGAITYYAGIPVILDRRDKTRMELV